MPGMPANIINLIADNLNDRYETGFPILKELIQNSDDAEATKFWFGYNKGLSSIKNPLLVGPALVCYNNGKFKPSDVKAIASFADNSKAGEEGTIGKFGLGMKSVFHLCEAFFYVANDGSKVHRALVNPWCPLSANDENFHPDWEIVSEDAWKQLESFAQDISSGDSTWFMLWIPLRQERHLLTPSGESAGAFVPRFPGDVGLLGPDLDFLRDTCLKSRLASILPLLPNLSKISSSTSSKKDFALSLQADGRLKRKVPETSATGSVRDLVGDSAMAFYGKKIECVGESIFRKLKDHAKWPIMRYRDELGRQRVADDKSAAEGSVIICRHDGGRGKVTIQWALFLPLEDENHTFEGEATHSKADYTIYLHGQFFVDAGRKGIFAYDQLCLPQVYDIDNLDDTALRQCWNYQLAHQVSLPLLLPTLAEFVAKHSIEEDEVVALTGAIVKAASKESSGNKALFAEMFKHSICTNHSWCKVIEPGSQNWKLIDHSEVKRLLRIPAPPKVEPDRPWLAMPSLSLMAPETSFVDATAPSLSNKIDQWTEHDATFALGGDTYKAFSSSTYIEYLARFIEYSVPGYLFKLDSVQKALLSLVQKGFRFAGLQAMRKSRQQVVNIVRFLLPQHRLAIGSSDPAANTAIPEHILSALWECDADTLILPKDLDHRDTPGQASVNRSDALSWLRVLDGLVGSQDSAPGTSERCLDVAEGIFDALQDDARSSILRTDSKLKILRAIDPSSLQTLVVSHLMLQEAWTRHNLFGYVSGQTSQARVGFGPLLANVLPDEQVIVVGNKTFGTAFGNSDVLPSSGQSTAILASLGTVAKKLGPFSARKALLEKINDPSSDDVARKGLRYLLHGDAQHFDDERTTLWVAGRQQSSLAWEKLWRQVTGIDSDGAWNILSRDLVGTVPAARWQLVGIKEIEPSDVIAEINNIGTSAISSNSFADEECEKILEFVSDDQLWLDLPFHELSEGGRCRVLQNTYLDTGISLPASLKSTVQIIRRSQNPTLAKRQLDWIPLLDESAVVFAALSSDDPNHYSGLIMEMLERSRGVVGVKAEQKLLDTAWLTLKSGHSVTPADVIKIDKLSDEIQILASKAAYCYADFADLDEAILKHPGLAYLEASYVTKGEAALKILGLLMAEVSGYAVGNITVPDQDRLVKVLPALLKVTELPAWKIVSSAEMEFGADSCLQFLLPAIAQPLPPEVFVNLFNQLASFCAGKRVGGAESAFDLYLEALSKDPRLAVALLPHIKLRSRSGHWKLSSLLCHGAADVDPSCLLDEKQAITLNAIVRDSSRHDVAANETGTYPEFDQAHRDSAHVLKKYFAAWKERVPTELIGTVISMMGPSLRYLANEYLSPHTADWLFDQIVWKDADVIIPDGHGNKALIPRGRHKDIWMRSKVAIRVVPDDTVSVTNLLGTKIKVPLSQELNTLIAGALDAYAGFRYFVPFRTVPIESYTDAALIDLIKNTIRYLLDKCFFQPQAGLEGLWDELDKSDQLQIDVVRGMILDHLPFYLRQLNAPRRSEKLRTALDEYDHAREQYQESKSSKSTSERLESRLRALDRQRAVIADILQKDDEVKQAVLDGLKQKLADFQYDHQSIPFELFQNADDAAVELKFFNVDGEIPAPAKRIVIDVEERVLRFMHWGRKITSNPEGGRQRGFHRDLEKMLVLSSSDKQIDVTGKFGLGFKSVFLCCDRPRIVSGRLRVEISGGVLPQAWTPSAAALSKLSAYTEDRRNPGTLVELEINDGVIVDALLERFREQAGLLAVFGRAIRMIELVYSAGECSYEWRPREVIDAVEVGEVQFEAEGGTVTGFALVFRLYSGTVLFRLSPEGVSHLPKRVPSLWVTAPTREEESLGFAVSADFSLDAGRGRLAGDYAANVQRAEKIGRELGARIVSLIQNLEMDWASKADDLHLSAGISLAGFLATIWRTLATGASSKEGTGICRTIALAALQKMISVPVPNGLPSPFELLIPRDNARYELSEIWRQREILGLLPEAGVAIEECIASDISKQLHILGLNHKVQQVTFSLLVSLVERGKSSEETACCLHSLADILWENLHSEEKSLALGALGNLQFRNANGEWVASRNLLCLGISEDEGLRFRFAPLGYRLSDEYSEKGKCFFKRCRQSYSAPAELLAEWIRQADIADTRKAALEYLRHGELGYRTVLSLRQVGLSGTWLETVGETHEYLQDWDKNDRDELLRILVSRVSFEAETPIFRPPPPKLTAKKALDSIHCWWSKNRRDEIRRYEANNFPQGHFPSLKHDFLKKEPEARKGWLTLFLLGACHTIGRSKPEAHREFIEICHSKGWIDTFVKIHRNGLEEWMDVLKSYIQNEMQDPRYYHWMRQFISVFVLGHWLDEYVDSFMAVNLMTAPFSLKHVTDPRINSALDRGGPDAPPADRALGMGACFIMRELFRNGMIKNTLAHRFCYVPRRPTRHFLEKLGCDLSDCYDHENRSKAIHDFLCQHLGEEKATFCNDFDLPILLVAMNQQVQDDLFNETLTTAVDIEEESYDYGE